MGIKFKHAGMSSLQCGGLLYLIAGVLLITINTLIWFILNWLMPNNLSWYFDGTFLTVSHCWHVLECVEYGCIFWSGSQHYASSEHLVTAVRKTFLLLGKSIKQSSRFQSPGSTLNVWVVRGWKTGITHSMKYQLRSVICSFLPLFFRIFFIHFLWSFLCFSPANSYNLYHVCFWVALERCIRKF